jgi:hypothetical protein
VCITGVFVTWVSSPGRDDLAVDDGEELLQAGPANQYSTDEAQT